MSGDGTEQTRWWGKPHRARRFHVFEGEGNVRSLCGGWMLRYNDQEPHVDPQDDTFTDGEDCKECARKAGVLDGESL